MKIIVDKDIPFVEEYFSVLGDVEKIDGRLIKTNTVKHADVLIVRSITTVNKSLLHKSSVRYVATVTSGADHIDKYYLDVNGIGFGSAPGSNARSVAEYVLSSLFALMDQVGVDVTQKTVGIIGCGHVGSQVRQFFKILGLECLTYDPPLKDATADDQYCELADVLSADIISLHVPLVQAGAYPTWRMIDDDFLRQLKSDVVLINTSRGDVIDERALLNFLDSNRQASVVLDVWSGEPEINVDLLSRVYIGTAHIAGYSMDAKLLATRTVFKQVCEYFRTDYDIALTKTFYDMDISVISISDYDDEIDVIQMAILTSFDVRTDSGGFKQVLDIGRQQRGMFFDELRSNYRSRREFNSLHVRLPQGSEHLARQLNDLGFRTSSGNE